jgi:hypothetical protein
MVSADRYSRFVCWQRSCSYQKERADRHTGFPDLTKVSFYFVIFRLAVRLGQKSTTISSKAKTAEDLPHCVMLRSAGPAAG